MFQKAIPRENRLPKSAHGQNQKLLVRDVCLGKIISVRESQNGQLPKILLLSSIYVFTGKMPTETNGQQ